MSEIDQYMFVPRLCYVAGVPTQRNLVVIQPTAPYFGVVVPAQYLERSAAEDFHEMRKSAALDGLLLVIWSGWRDHQHQERLYREWEQGKRKMRPAKPGWSLHESGEAADILRSHDDPDASGPMVGPTDRWLSEHSRGFNFLANVKGEPWHFSHIR